jgi:hypothetical protein
MGTLGGRPVRAWSRGERTSSCPPSRRQRRVSLAWLSSAPGRRARKGNGEAEDGAQDMGRRGSRGGRGKEERKWRSEAGKGGKRTQEETTGGVGPVPRVRLEFANFNQ